jgi:hypothetical protein
VVANDLAERSVIVGRALIENDRVGLERDELARMFRRGSDEPGFVETNMAPDVFPTKHARFLDSALANAREMTGPKRWLAFLLIVKYALRLRPMGNWGAKTIVRQMEAGDYEAMNPNYVRDVFARGVPYHPLRMAEKLRASINRGVFANGQRNEVHQADVLEWLPTVDGDIAFLDPPYSGTLAYEKASRPLDEMLAGEKQANGGGANPFSSEPPERILPQLFEAAASIPLWIVTYGNGRIGLEELKDLVRRHRPVVEGFEVKHAHCTGLATEESKARNRELVVVGRMK